MKNRVVDTTTVGGRLQKLREDKHLTQEQLSEIMYIKKSTLSAYENNKVDIKGSVLIELSKHLDTTPNYILGIEDTEKENEFLSKASTLLSQITDRRTQEILLVQISALLNRD